MDTQLPHDEIEERWRAAWEESGVFRTPDAADDPEYVLGMFPYPSGELHMGHVRNYTITDAYARFKRMRGEEVLHPMGWDAFGLPAENAALERDTNPRDWTFDCIERMRGQMREMGFSYDWEREVTTCVPEYYRWNQWLFRRFHEAGLVERKSSEVNWCPSCETVLADEQVEGEAELCWRCDTPVEARELDQWFLKITEYADDLLAALDDLDGWPESVKGMQRNWIGRQEGATVEFEVHEASASERSSGEQGEPRDYGPVEVFTTRLDTIFGATFFALAPDHEIAEDVAARDDDVAHFVEAVADPEGDEPKGVRTDLTATNPATGEEVPVYVADFVLSDVGTGALMGVPGHDERDHAFATAHGIDIVPVVTPDPDEVPDVEVEAYTTDQGALINSGDYDGLSPDEARDALVADLPSAEHATQYRLRDWGISRQRYWGTPIPVVHCEDCGPVLVPEEDLPVELPEFVNTPGNPLDAAEEWKHTTCPECGGEHAHRETDTMDTFVDSSWYFLRYVSPDEDDAPFDVERANDWMPVDQYVGGIEHAVMHLLYSRFVTKAVADMDMLSHREPFTNLLAQGMVQLDGEAMSKSKGNVVSPQEITAEYGADTARLFMMQAAQPESDFDWSPKGVRSSHRFLGRLYDAVHSLDDADSGGDPGSADEYVQRYVDATVATATDEYEDMLFNVAAREVQNLFSVLRQYRDATDPDPETLERGYRAVVKLLAPVAPHVAEELWDALGSDGFVAEANWPEPETDISTFDVERALIEDTREDVRDILDVADITDPERIDIVVAPAWKHDTHEFARTADTDNVVGELMERDEFRERGDDAASYAKDLQARRQELQEVLDPDGERAVLERATWLLEREFDAGVEVATADDADPEVASKAEPGKPAIEIT
jgi:leucyl-tRNA synthetase